MEEVSKSPTWGLRALDTFSVKPHSSLRLSSTWGKILKHLFRERLQFPVITLEKVEKDAGKNRDPVAFDEEQFICWNQCFSRSR